MIANHFKEKLGHLEVFYIKQYFFFSKVAKLGGKGMQKSVLLLELDKRVSLIVY
jgi:hypothetical protein